MTDLTQIDLAQITPPLRFTAGTKEIWQALATIPRTGWIQWGILNPETVAKHILASRTLALSWQNELELKTTELQDVLALIEVHDWPKIGAGDRVILGDELEVEALRNMKKQAEREAMESLCISLPEREVILELYNRFEVGVDRHAIIAREVGLFQTLFTAKRYEEQFKKPGLLKEFIIYTRDSITLPFLIKELSKIEKLQK